MKEKIGKIIRESLNSVDSDLKDAFEARQVEIYSEERCHDPSSKKLVWVFAEIREENVCFGYSEDGFDGENLKWGLMFLGQNNMGDSGAWYRELHELIDDCGYF